MKNRRTIQHQREAEILGQSAREILAEKVTFNNKEILLKGTIYTTENVVEERPSEASL